MKEENGKEISMIGNNYSGGSSSNGSNNSNGNYEH